MSIIRVSKHERYVIIEKTGLEDARLSFKAIGLLAYLLSKPNHWSISTRGLENTHSDGRTAIMAGLKELEDAGYLHRERRLLGPGRIEWETVLYERPVVDFEHPHGAETRLRDDLQEQRESAGGSHSRVSHPRKTAPISNKGTTEKPLSQTTKTEPQPCPHGSDLCNGYSSFCDRCARERRSA